MVSASRHRPAPILAGIFLVLAILGCPNSGKGAEERSPFGIEAHRWEEADKIFRTDPHWLGGDGASSVDLGNGRVLWLFGDSLIDLSGSRTRHASVMVRNSIAVQTGYDPVNAKIQFFWKMKDGTPSPFFSCSGERWYWPASGILIGRRLLLFLMEICKADNALGFEAGGWKGVLIDNPEKSPDNWKLTYLKSPQKQRLVVGSGNPILENGFLYVFAADSQDRSIYLVRWPKRSVLGGTLVGPQWWAGDKTGWVGPEETEVKLSRIIADGQMEFSVEYSPLLKRYLQIQTLSIMNPCLALSTAMALTGPWSAHTCVFTPSETGKADLMIYAGKSHPMLSGGEMALTYVVNANREDRILGDMSLYFPLMVKGRIILDH
jgi:hypothetical protein